MKTAIFSKAAIIVIVIITIFSFLPFYIMVVMGTHETSELFNGIQLLPGDFLVNNLKTVFGQDFLRFYLNSFYIAFLVTAIAVFTSSLTGFAFAKYNFKYKNVLYIVILGTMMIPGQLGLIGFVIEMHWFGWLNSHLPLIVPSLISPFGVFLMTQYIKSSVPGELLESARIDGCNDFRAFLQIVFPVIKPAIITLCLLFFLWSWNNYLLPLVIVNDQSLYTVPLGISLLTLLYRIDYGAEILALTIAVLPVVAMFIFGSGYIVKGLTAGALKG